ncbi:MAG: TolC family protein, partial [Caldimonas sp.]
MLVAGVVLGGCSVAPVYQVPSAPVPSAYKEAPAGGAEWLPAAPADALDRGDWWTLFGDAELDRLAARVSVSNQTVAAAVAAVEQAQALVREQQAALFPSLALDASAQRAGGRGAASSGNSFRASVGASWEPDLFGRLRGGVDVARASAQASAADLANAKLSAQAALAIAYFS